MADILVIEDDSKFSKMLKKMLESREHQVTEAPNGFMGIELFRQGSFDLIITDIFMPDKEGIETIIELSKEFPGARIIAISGGGKDGTVEYLDHAKELGAIESFSKPFDMDEFLTAVDRVLTE